MPSDQRVIIASQDSVLAWALHRELERFARWKLIDVIDPRIGEAFERACSNADIVLIEAADLAWLWDHKWSATQVALSTTWVVVIVDGRQLVDVLARTEQACGLLIHPEGSAVPIALLELAIKGYIALPEALLHRLTTDRARLDVLDTLSREERGVVAYLGTALSNRGIAEASGITESRVKALVHLITHKLHMKNRTAVAVFAAINGVSPLLSKIDLPLN